MKDPLREAVDFQNALADLIVTAAEHKRHTRWPPFFKRAIARLSAGFRPFIPKRCRGPSGWKWRKPDAH